MCRRRRRASSQLGPPRQSRPAKQGKMRRAAIPASDGGRANRGGAPPCAAWCSLPAGGPRRPQRRPGQAIPMNSARGSGPPRVPRRPYGGRAAARQGRGTEAVHGRERPPPEWSEWGLAEGSGGRPGVHRRSGRLQRGGVAARAPLAARPRTAAAGAGGAAARCGCAFGRQIAPSGRGRQSQQK